jgi:outer membrane biosynthesis protein TonB
MSQSQSQIRSKVVAQTAMRRMRPTTERGPRYGAVGSLLFHGLIFAALLFTFQRNFKAPEETHMVPVDLVTIADQTNVAAQAPPQPEPQKIDVPPPVLEPPPLPDLQEVEPAPEANIPDFDVAKEKPKPVEKPPEPPRESKQKQATNFDALLNKLTAPQKPVKNAKVGPRVIQGIGTGNLMTADLADALRGQIYRCWSPPTGAPNAQDLVVEYDLALNPDGTVGRLQMTMGTAAAAAGNTYTRAAAEAASRAIYQCQPYRLPADRYNQWREINPLRFDPRQMMGQ